MPKFSQESLQNLASAHPDLQRLFNEVIKHKDCIILCGYRGKTEQNAVLLQGKSLDKFPNSKHNMVPSRAVDVIPNPTNWSNIDEFRSFGKFVENISLKLGVGIYWGGNIDNNINNLCHFELKDK